MPILGRAGFGRLGDIIRGVAFVTAMIAIVIVVVLARAGGLTDPGAEVATSAAAATASVAWSTPPTSPTQTLQPPPESASPAPTVAPTSIATPRPARTPRPTGDPRPEGTPRIHRASGHLGETIDNDGVSVLVNHAPMPPTFDIRHCSGGDDPEMQGYTEAFAFEMTLSWSGVKDMPHPYLEIGDDPFSFMEFDHEPTFASGHPEVFVVCHRPEESMLIRVGAGINGSNPSIEYYWTIR